MKFFFFLNRDNQSFYYFKMLIGLTNYTFNALLPDIGNRNLKNIIDQTTLCTYIPGKHVPLKTTPLPSPRATLFLKHVNKLSDLFFLKNLISISFSTSKKKKLILIVINSLVISIPIAHADGNRWKVPFPRIKPNSCSVNWFVRIFFFFFVLQMAIGCFLTMILHWFRVYRAPGIESLLSIFFFFT